MSTRSPLSTRTTAASSPGPTAIRSEAGSSRRSLSTNRSSGLIGWIIFRAPGAALQGREARAGFRATLGRHRDLAGGHGNIAPGMSCFLRFRGGGAAPCVGRSAKARTSSTVLTY